jgi:hypothetical protein
MRPTRPAGTGRSWVWALLAVLWLGSTGTGLYLLWAWDNTPGTSATARDEWPAESRLARDYGRPTLVMLVHPQCTCSRASLSELAELLTRAHPRPKTYVLFLRPTGFSDGWEQTDLWRTASALKDVTVLRDDEGVQAARFGGATSGQTFLYDARGALQFSGGITAARAHAGDNAGRSAVVAFVNGSAPGTTRTSVFGCPLFDRPPAGGL